VGETDSLQAEEDEILMLLAYGIALEDWQPETADTLRGHNIAAVLVDPNGRISAWARNCSFATGNTTHHAESTLIEDYLSSTDSRNLKGHTLYTTLEPCAMCAGMMIIAGVRRVVYGQTDPGFGKALERLGLDSRPLDGGFAPYPRRIASEASNCGVRDELENGYRNFMASGRRGIVKWLRTDDARGIFEDAVEHLRTYQVNHDVNASVLEAARAVHDEAGDGCSAVIDCAAAVPVRLDGAQSESSP
jgi:tRNA(Arg) A34 adenosine deaminase TadA